MKEEEERKVGKQPAKRRAQQQEKSGTTQTQTQTNKQNEPSEDISEDPPLSYCSI
jgi:hypothetical protein